MTDNDSFHIRADYVLAARDQLFAPGMLTLRAGRVIDVRSARSGHTESVDLDLEGYALLPGLVNPHTHLEFSDLEEPLVAGEHFPAWIGSVIRQRLSRGEDAKQLLERAIARGLRESFDAGVVALADIVTPPWTPDLLQNLSPIVASQSPFAERCAPRDRQRFQAQLQRLSPLPKVLGCLELLGVTGDRADRLRQWRDELLEVPRGQYPDRLLELALSPHAPYSTPVDLWNESARLGERDGRLLVMHLAESPAEREWIDSGSGPMAAMLERIGASTHRPQSDWIVQAIQQLARARRALIVHGNYLTETEMDKVAAHRDRLSVVYCPRTHQHFGHQTYPLAQLLDRGIRVVFGTDSRSSNPDLNLWREAACAAAHHTCLRPTQVLDAITQSAAESLGISPRFGTLLPGAVAAINALPTFGFHQPHELDAMLERNFAETMSVMSVAQ